MFAVFEVAFMYLLDRITKEKSMKLKVQLKSRVEPYVGQAEYQKFQVDPEGIIVVADGFTPEYGPRNVRI